MGLGVWGKLKWDLVRCHHGGTNERTNKRKDRATQPIDHGPLRWANDPPHVGTLGFLATPVETHHSACVQILGYLIKLSRLLLPPTKSASSNIMTAETFSDHLFTIYSISCIFIKYNYELNLKNFTRTKKLVAPNVQDPLWWLIDEHMIRP